MTTRIDIPEHLKEYLQGKYCDFEDKAVRFPDSSDTYHLLYDLLEKRPLICQVDRGNLEIQLPVRRYGKHPATYNYLGKRSQQILIRHIEVKMWAEFHDYIDQQKHMYGIMYADSVHSFITRYGIYSLSEDAFIKNYYRWRGKERPRAEKRKYVRKK